jgi:type VI secretion system protein ImpK
MREAAIEAQTVAELCTEIFLLILRMQTMKDFGEFDPIYRNTQSLFQSFEQQCRDRGIEADDVTTVKYALAAFVDGTVLNSRWPYKEKWADDPLQLNYFGTFLAGEIFFDKLEEIRARADSKADLLEVYYLCLLLGFKGKYGMGGTEKLRTLIENVGNELSRLKSERPLELSPHWKIPDGPLGRTSDNVTRGLFAACCLFLVIIVVIFFVLFFRIRSDAQSLNEQIKEQASTDQSHYSQVFSDQEIFLTHV